MHPFAGLLTVFQLWHLLSLDAPTIAFLWACTFARVAHVYLPVHAPLLLALGTWLFYVADRILDGFNSSATVQLRERHYFCLRHRAEFLVAAAAVVCAVLWLVLTRMTPRARHEDTLLFAAAIVYFFLIHSPGKLPGTSFQRRAAQPGRGSERWFPKELAVGLIFAAATAVPSWSRAAGPHTTLLPVVLLFVALCWLNCVAIETWEHSTASKEAETSLSHITTRFLGSHLTAAALVILGVAALTSLVALAHSQRALGITCLATVMSTLLFVVLNRAQRSIPLLELRIAADAALLTPLFILPLSR